MYPFAALTLCQCAGRRDRIRIRLPIYRHAFRDLVCLAVLLMRSPCLLIGEGPLTVDADDLHEVDLIVTKKLIVI